MNRTKLWKLSTGLLTLVLVITLSGPVFARENESTGEKPARLPASTEGHQPQNKDLQMRGEALLSEKRKQKTAEQRQKFCQNHKQGLEQKFSRISANTEKHKTRIDDIFAKVQAYQQANNPQPENYDDLVAAAQAAEVAAASSITDLKAVKPTIDCASNSNAANVATFKAAAQQARDDIKAYKTAVKAVLKALRDLKVSNEGEGSNQ